MACCQRGRWCRDCVWWRRPACEVRRAWVLCMGPDGELALPGHSL